MIHNLKEKRLIFIFYCNFTEDVFNYGDPDPSGSPYEETRDIQSYFYEIEERLIRNYLPLNNAKLMAEIETYRSCYDSLRSYNIHQDTFQVYKIGIKLR